MSRFNIRRKCKMSAPSEAQTTETAQTTQESAQTVQTFQLAQTPPVINTTDLKAPFAVLMFLGLWVLAGIAAVIMSLVCFGLSGSTAEKFIGLAVAFFLGPLYFIFYGVNKGYCRNMGANVVQTIGGFRS